MLHAKKLHFFIYYKYNKYIQNQMFRKTKFYLWELRVKIPKIYAVWFIPVFLSLGKR